MNQIPEITHPLGRHWRQPPVSRILIDDTHAVMERPTLEALMEYSSSTPSGVYDGKMWKCRTVTGWLLVWYGPSCDPNKCSINKRQVLLI